MKRLLLLSLFSVPLASCTFILGFQKSLQCGDGILTEAKGEECDDGNTDPANGQTDNCSADCKIPVCGDGIVDPFGTVDRNGDGIINFNDGNEQCDANANANHDSPRLMSYGSFGGFETSRIVHCGTVLVEEP